MSWDIEQIGECMLYRGDALEVLPTLPDASVHLALLDPPYMNCKPTAWDRQWPTRDAYLSWLRHLAKEWHRILTPNGSLYCFASPQMAAWVEIMLSESFNVLTRIQWLKQNGWHKKADPESLCSWLSPREEIIFAEQYGAQYEEASQALHKAIYAPLGRYIATERERAGVTRDQVDVGLGYVWTKDLTRGTELCRRWEEGNSLPTREAYERLRALLNASNGCTDYLRREYEDLRRPFTISANVPYTDVFDFKTVPASLGKHPCEKPLSLLRHIITASSRPHDTVLDCFMGSGSTLDAARQCGRQAIGIEQDPHWYHHAVRRLSQEDLFTHQAPPPQAAPPPRQEALW